MNNPEYLTAFRTGTDQDQNTIDWLLAELQAGRLRQGWGADGLSLLDEKGKEIGKTQWEKNYLDVYGHAPSSRRYSALWQMLYLQDGDIVVIPKLPKYSQFSIARVTGGYRFAAGEPQDRNDFRHIIPVDPNSVRTFHKNTNSETYAVSGLFRRANHRYPVTFAYGNDHIEAAATLLESDSCLKPEASDVLLQASLDDALECAAEAMQEKIKSWDGHQFEVAIQAAFKNQGYEIDTKYRRYDRKGADVDIVARPPSNHLYSRFMPTEIAVQVKWKQGVDNDDIQAVEQLSKWDESDLVQKFVISSADDFTAECKKKADDENITLIGGLDTMYFLMGLPNYVQD